MQVIFYFKAFNNLSLWQTLNLWPWRNMKYLIDFKCQKPWYWHRLYPHRRYRLALCIFKLIKKFIDLFIVIIYFLNFRIILTCLIYFFDTCLIDFFLDVEDKYVFFSLRVFIVICERDFYLIGTKRSGSLNIDINHLIHLIETEMVRIKAVYASNIEGHWVSFFVFVISKNDWLQKFIYFILYLVSDVATLYRVQEKRCLILVRFDCQKNNLKLCFSLRDFIKTVWQLCGNQNVYDNFCVQLPCQECESSSLFSELNVTITYAIASIDLVWLNIITTSFTIRVDWCIESYASWGFCRYYHVRELPKL